MPEMPDLGADLALVDPGVFRLQVTDDQVPLGGSGRVLHLDPDITDERHQPHRQDLVVGCLPPRHLQQRRRRKNVS